MKVLITGAAGFVGSHLVERLLNDPGVSLVRGIDNFSTGKRANLESFHDKIDFIEGSLLEEGARARAVADVDVVFHQAAIPSVPRSVDSPVESHLNGSHSTLLLLESARQAGVKRLIFAASSSAYGNAAVSPKHEGLPPSPLSPYAATKVACEQYVRAYALCYSMDTVSLRYFNVFGPRQDPFSPYSGVIARFCSAYQGNGKLVIFGDGEQSRDFTYVANVVEANLLAARYPGRLGGEVFNVGAGKQTSLNQLVQLFNEITGKQLSPERQPERMGDVKHSLADVSKAETILGYVPKIGVKEGLARTLAWFREVHAAAVEGANAPNRVERTCKV